MSTANLILPPASSNSTTNATSADLSADSGKTMAQPLIVKILVYDKVKKISRSFLSDSLVIEKYMTYFIPIIAQQRQKLIERGSGKDSDITINVNCDVEIFSWLFQFITYSAFNPNDGGLRGRARPPSPPFEVPQQRPKIDSKRVVSLILSSHFLGMTDLCLEACRFLCENLGVVLMSDISLNCLPSAIVDNLLIGDGVMQTSNISQNGVKSSFPLCTATSSFTGGGEATKGLLSITHIVDACLYIAAQTQRLKLADLQDLANKTVPPQLRIHGYSNNSIGPVRTAVGSDCNTDSGGREGGPANTLSPASPIQCPNRAFLVTLVTRVILKSMHDQCVGSCGCSGSAGGLNYTHRLRWCMYCGTLFGMPYTYRGSAEFAGDGQGGSGLDGQFWRESVETQCPALRAESSHIGPRGEIQKTHVATSFSAGSFHEQDGKNCQKGSGGTQCFCSRDLPVLQEVLLTYNCSSAVSTRSSAGASSGDFKRAAGSLDSPGLNSFWISILDRCATLVAKTKHFSAATTASATAISQTPVHNRQPYRFFEVSALQQFAHPKELLCWILFSSAVVVRPTRRTIERRMEGGRGVQTWASMSAPVALIEIRRDPLGGTYAPVGDINLGAGGNFFGSFNSIPNSNCSSTGAECNSTTSGLISSKDTCVGNFEGPLATPFERLIFFLRWCLPTGIETLFDSSNRVQSTQSSLSASQSSLHLPSDVTSSSSSGKSRRGREMPLAWTSSESPKQFPGLRALWTKERAQNVFDYLGNKQGAYEGWLRYRKQMRIQILLENGGQPPPNYQPSGFIKTAASSVDDASVKGGMGSARSTSGGHGNQDPNDSGSDCPGASHVDQISATAPTSAAQQHQASAEEISRDFTDPTNIIKNPENIAVSPAEMCRDLILLHERAVYRQADAQLHAHAARAAAIASAGDPTCYPRVEVMMRRGVSRDIGIEKKGSLKDQRISNAGTVFRRNHGVPRAASVSGGAESPSSVADRQSFPVKAFYVSQNKNNSNAATGVAVPQLVAGKTV